MCGVVGVHLSSKASLVGPVAGPSAAAQEIFLGLTSLQHRGQDAAGILSYDAKGFHSVKNIGLVEQVFNRENIASLTGSHAIGHVRYTTAGRGDLNEVQPFLLNYPFGIGLIHNGNLVNAATLASELKTRSRRTLISQSDTEVLINVLADALSRTPAGKGDVDLDAASIGTAMTEIMTRAQGSYSVVALIAGHGLLAFRDPLGIRPLSFGCRGDGDARDWMVASESATLTFLGYAKVDDLQPGEWVWISGKGGAPVRGRGVPLKSGAAGNAKHCMFEWVYFSSPESMIDGSPVYGSRIAMGRELAQGVRERLAKDGREVDVIVPVPETSRIAAIALAEELGRPYRELLIKNRYIKRTFILDSQEKRQSAVSLKLSPVRSEIEGKRVLLVDDSIVRGTTSRKIVELVRAAGAKEVGFVSTCPPIRHPCFYGIDFPDSRELIAYGKDLAAIERELGADFVVYQEVEGLSRALGQEGKLCLACLTGEYPAGRIS